MAVYTELSQDDLAGFLTFYEIGGLLSCKGIAEGVENSNYLLMTEAGPFILTLYEKRVAPADLPFFLGLMRHLAVAGIACPVPVIGQDGNDLRQAAGKPAALFTFLNGMAVTRPSRAQCRALGAALARMHLAGQGYNMARPNALGPAGWPKLVESCLLRADEVAPGLATGIAAGLAALQASWPRDLPQGIIHADLFPDNVFFQDDTLSGIIDFYFACTDALAYDLAIVLNAWCFEPDRQFNATKARAVVAGYQSVRPLGPDEIVAMPLLARGAALRFLLTRLYDWLHPVPGALVKPKDPLEYWAKLKFHQATPDAASYGLYT